MANAVIDFSQMTVSVVAVITDVVRDEQPVVGYAYHTNGRYAASGLMRERFIPRLLSAEPDSLLDSGSGLIDPFKAWARMMSNEKPGGHGERSVAVGVIDIAIWDAVAKAQGRPLYRLLADRFNDGVADERASVYAAGGYYDPEKGLDGLRAEMRSYLDRGYTTVKMKIGGATLAEDLKRIEAVVDEVGTGSRVAVDANARLDLRTAIAYGRAMSPFGLAWFEEPGDPLDYALNAALCDEYDRPVATGENLFSVPDARNLMRYGGMRPDRDFLQFDCTLAYGICEYARILSMVRRNGWSPRRLVPHGGHLLSLALATGLQLGGCEAYPDVFRPFSGFSDGTPVADGFIAPPEAPGVGYETQAEVYALMRQVAEAS